MIQKPTWLQKCKVEILQNVFSWLHLKYEDSFISLPSFFLINIYCFSKVCTGLMTKNRYTVCITENIDTKLRSQDYFQLRASFQQEITKVVVDSNTPRAGEPKTEIEPATEIFCHIYHQPLSPTLYFLSCSKQSLLKIEKYEKREREGRRLQTSVCSKSNFNQRS